MKFAATTWGMQAALLVSVSVVGLVGAPIASAIDGFAHPPAATETPAPSDEPTTPSTDDPSTEPSAEPSPSKSDEPVLSCEDLRAADLRPKQYDSDGNSAWVALKASEPVAELEGVADSSGKPASGTHELIVNPRLYASSYFSELGCAEEGSMWVVVSLGDDYNLNGKVGNGGISYESVLDLDASSLSLKLADGETVQLDSSFVATSTGSTALVFVVPTGTKAGVFNANLVFTSTNPRAYSDAVLPEVVTFGYNLIPIPFVLGERGGCAPIGQGWC